MSKIWKARFDKDIDELADEFNSSLPVDKKMYGQDILASAAHAKMLGKCGIIPTEDADKIIDGLNEILEDVQKGALIIQDAEDIHMFVEQELTKRIGE
ncbi:MAG: lyase family protein, partial [Christensenellales bacterium]